jgi:hypothetical protein
MMRKSALVCFAFVALCAICVADQAEAQVYDQKRALQDENHALQIENAELKAKVAVVKAAVPIGVRVRELRLTLGCGQLMLKYKIVLKQIERIAERLGVYATAGATL